MHPSADESDVPGVVGRRSARLSIIVPITLRGTDASGQPFKENTWTISVNKHGGRIATFHLLTANDQIVIENPLLGRTARARVSRVCERRFAEDPYEVCVELQEAQNVWGVKLPPEDWLQERQGVPGEQKGTGAEAAPQTPETSAPAAEKDQQAEISRLAPPRPPEEAGESTGGISQFSMALNALSRLAGEASSPPAQTVSPRQEPTGTPKAPAADLLALKSLQEKIDEAQLLREEMSFIVDRARSAQAEAEGLLSKAREAHREVSSEAERLAKQIEEAGDRKLQSVLSRLDKEIEQKLEPASARWAGETERQLQAGATGIVESVTKELGERLPPLAQESLSKAVLEFRAECKRAAGEARAELDELVKETRSAAEAGIRKVTEEVSPSLSVQMEQAAAEAGRRQLEGLKTQIENARKSGEDSIQHGMEEKRREIEAGTVNRVQSARAEVEDLLSKVSAARREVSLEAERVARQIEEATGAKLQSVLSRLDQEVEQKLESASARWAGETEQRLQAGATGVVENATKELGERLPPLAQENVSKAVLEFQAECTRTAEEVGRRQLEELKAQIESARKNGEDSIQRRLEEMRREIEAETLSRAQPARAEVEDLLSKVSAARHEASLEAERVARQIEEATGAKLQSVLSRLDQEVEQKLESASARWAGETEQRLQAGAASVVESVTKELGERLPPLAQEGLSKAISEFQAESKRVTEEAKAELDALAKEAAAIAESGIRKVTEEVSPSLSAQMELAAEEAARRQLEGLKAQLESVRKSGEDSILHGLERIRQEIQAEVLNAGTQARRICKEESDIAAKAISVCVDSAVDSLNRAGDEVAVKLQAARQTLELGLKKAEEEYLPRLAGESASMLEKFRVEAQGIGAQLQSEVATTAREFSEKASREISEKLESTVEGALEVVAREFSKQGEDALEMLKEGLRSAREQCVEETQKHLAAARQSTLTSLESGAAALSSSFGEQLHSTLREMVGQQTKEIEATTQASLQGLLESLRTKIQLTADESAARAMAEIRRGAEQALEELPERLYKGVGMAALVAREWEEQAKVHLERHSRQLLEVFQNRLEALNRAAQERQRSDAEALRSLFQGRLNQAARLFEGSATEAGQAKETTREESGNPAVQPAQPSKDSSPPGLEPLVEKQGQIVEELLSAFRSRLNQILAG